MFFSDISFPLYTISSELNKGSPQIVAEGIEIERAVRQAIILYNGLAPRLFTITHCIEEAYDWFSMYLPKSHIASSLSDPLLVELESKPGIHYSESGSRATLHAVHSPHQQLR